MVLTRIVWLARRIYPPKVMFFTGARSLAEHRRAHWLASHVSIVMATLLEDLPWTRVNYTPAKWFHSSVLLDIYSHTVNTKNPLRGRLRCRSDHCVNNYR